MALITIDNYSETIIARLKSIIDEVYEGEALTDSEIVRMALTVAYMFAGTELSKQAIFQDAVNDAKHKLVEQALPAFGDSASKEASDG